uniref:Chromosome 2 open reading frame 42 n=1 Tax=Chrysolophus pictus TaxID=9089 RepID=A0A8C3KZC9_CHRPC
MEPTSVRTKVPSFLSDLGKATLRGIRKCPRCGTYNGTRGLSCKNKNCGTVFRYGSRKQPGVDAVKIITGSDLQLYSVRQRDRGPDYRCFVELGVSETAIQTVDGTIITQLSSGRCYVPTCLKAATQGVVENQCQHVKLALNCQTEATPLTLKSSVLNSMQASPETKQTIWQLATEPTGPLVQRITKSVLVVKCKASQKHSLGYLHASFAQKMSTKTLAEHRFFCSCQSLKPGKAASAKEEAAAQRCIHFFACICAFASDESLAQEFADFLTYDSSGLKGIAVPQLACGPESTLQAGEAAKAKKRKKDLTPGPLLAQDTAGLRRSSLKKPTVAASLKRQGCNQLLDESQVTLSFQDWLASVTERIHQTMHYQFEGKPEPLVFHIPQAFFDALQQRISSGSTKKRLPNSTTAFVRKDALPLGTFSKYTWHITNILQVKQIFDTPEVRGNSHPTLHCPRITELFTPVLPSSCHWRSHEASSRTGMAPMSSSSAPRWRWRASLRRTGAWRSSQPSARWSSRPSSKWVSEGGNSPLSPPLGGGFLPLQCQGRPSSTAMRSQHKCWRKIPAGCAPPCLGRGAPPSSIHHHGAPKALRNASRPHPGDRHLHQEGFSPSQPRTKESYHSWGSPPHTLMQLCP